VAVCAVAAAFLEGLFKKKHEDACLKFLVIFPSHVRWKFVPVGFDVFRAFAFL